MRILPVRNLLSLRNLHLPAYQRPYKWTEPSVIQLIADISAEVRSPTKDSQECGVHSYRLGTVVFHRSIAPGASDRLDIVDGQQRILTLLLMIHALAHLARDGEQNHQHPKENLAELIENNSLFNELSFSNQLSIDSLRSNYNVALQELRRVANRQALTDFLLDRCEVVCFVLEDISEAFQFFDSQNARGKDLEPHDLLKAFHLREFHESNSKSGENPPGPNMDKAVEEWEARDTSELASLFGEYLFRTRNWISGRSARYFSKDDVQLFKGIPYQSVAAGLSDGGQDDPDALPYLRLQRSWLRNVQVAGGNIGSDATFPFQLDQKIVNGPLFFGMVKHYLRQLDRLRKIVGSASQPCTDPDANSLRREEGATARQILTTIDTYPGAYRTGDRYVRLLFDCLLLFYLDKFGEVEPHRAVEVAFAWAYRLRLQQTSVHLASIDKHVLDEQKNIYGNAFRHLRDAITPADFFNRMQPRPVDVRSDNAKKIEELFEQMNLKSQEKST